MDNNGANNKAVVKAGDPKKKTEWKQWSVFGLVILLIAAGGYFLGNGTVKAPADSAEDDALMGMDAERKDANGSAPSFSWAFAPAGGDGMTGAPFTQVTLLIDGEARDLGTYPGSCSIIGATDAWAPQVGELTGVMCSWDGDGVEFGVFFEAGTYVIKKGTLTEGAEGESSTRGGYEIVETI